MGVARSPAKWAVETTPALVPGQGSPADKSHPQSRPHVSSMLDFETVVLLNPKKSAAWEYVSRTKVQLCCIKFMNHRDLACW